MYAFLSGIARGEPHVKPLTTRPQKDGYGGGGYLWFQLPLAARIRWMITSPRGQIIPIAKIRDRVPPV